MNACVEGVGQGGADVGGRFLVRAGAHRGGAAARGSGEKPLFSVDGGYGRGTVEGLFLGSQEGE